MSRIHLSIAICWAVLILTGGGSHAADFSVGVNGGLSMVTGRTYGDFFDA